MSTRLHAFLLFLLAGCIAPPGTPDGTIELDRVMREVERALDAYQSAAGPASGGLPPLAAADLTFRTAASRSAGASVSLLVFKLGGGRSTEAVHEVSFRYVPRKRTEQELVASGPDLAGELLATIRKAAQAVAGTRPDELDLAQLSVQVQFAVRWDGSGSVTAPVDITTVGLQAGGQSHAVQSVRLTFAKPGAP